MSTQTSHYANINGRLINLSQPQVMGILNVTPDSFYEKSRCMEEKEIILRAGEILEEGASMIDIGAYSTRPGALEISAKEELDRLGMALRVIRVHYPDAIISVDTFRASVAKACVEEYGANIINDVSGGLLDEEMFRTIAKLHVPYILMHMIGTPQTMSQYTSYTDVTKDVFRHLGERVEQLHEMGVADIILDPGFGFSKTLQQNYELMAHLSYFKELNLPILVGISRKSMIYKLLGETANESLTGTTVLNTIALMQGANILRVHDVKEAVEAVKIVLETKKNSQELM